METKVSTIENLSAIHLFSSEIAVTKNTNLTTKSASTIAAVPSLAKEGNQTDLEDISDTKIPAATTKAIIIDETSTKANFDREFTSTERMTTDLTQFDSNIEEDPSDIGYKLYFFAT